MEISFIREPESHQHNLELRKSTTILRRAICWALSDLVRLSIVGSLTAACAFAQTAQVSGVITDSSGSVVPEATVTTLNNNTGISRPTQSNNEGYYMVPLLQPGNYMITVEASGFATQVRTGIILDVGSQQVLNITLQIGQTSQTVEVSGAALSVELASSSIGGVVGQTVIVDLPLNGRDWTQLATLQPAVNAIPTQRPTGATGDRGSRGYGNQLVISGTRPQLNNYRLDGISIVDYAGGAPGSVIGVALGVDAVAEFSVLTSNYSSEYGRTSGGVVNAITKSGTNQFHGDAYEFIRNSALDARNFFDGATIPPFKRNQFGASLGGPIQKGKTFFFADYEGLREARGVTNVDNVLSPGARNGVLHNPDGTTTAVNIDPLVKPFLSFYPLPNAGLLGQGDTGLFTVAVNTITRGDFETVRIDRTISEQDRVSGTFFHDAGLSEAPDALNDVVIGNTSHRTMISLEESHFFSPSLVNSLRVGFSRVAALSQVSLQALNPHITDLSLGAFPGLPAPQVSVPGLTDFYGGGVGPFTGNVFAWNSFQAYDDVFLTKGVHSLKFGVAFERMQFNETVPARPTGSFTFDTISDFLTNRPLEFQGQVPGTSTPRGLRQTLLGGYFQDDWRARPNLTLNLGLRYEMVTVPTEVQNKLVNLRTLTSPTPYLGSPLFNNPTLRDFEPRVGFAWDPFHNAKTAVRGAFGIFDVLPLTYEFFNIEGHPAPFSQNLSASNLAPGSFPAGAVGSSNVVPASKLQTGYIEFNPHRNYLMIWNLNVQRQLTSSISVMVGYVGNHGVHMLNREDDMNTVIPVVTPQGLLWPSPTGSGTVINPAVGDIRGDYWGGSSEFDALEVHLSKRMSHGFQAGGSYTWGKNIDTGSASVLGDPFTNSISSPFFFCNSCRRGLSDYNIAQTVVVNYLWDVPTQKKWGAIGSHALGGWELGGIITAESGVPLTPILGGDPLGLNSSDPFAYPNRLSGPGCGSAVNPGNPNNYIKVSCFAAPNPLTLLGNAGRNSIVGPGLVNFDFSVFKNNYIKRGSEAFNVQFRAELFNILNRANFATPSHNSKLFDGNGNPVGGAGAVDQTSTPAREIQFALKVIW
jgi:hypothetical protein